MKTIEQQVTQNYLDNIAYLQKQHPSLYDQIAALETSIDKGYYQARYDLEYKDNYFDIIELSTGNYLYGSDSNNNAKLAAKSINYKKNENVIQTFFSRTFTEQELKHYQAQTVETSAYHGLAPIMDYSNKYAAGDATTMKDIKKFVFLGAGLGLHIETIHKKIAARAYLIIEDDLELFRLSLFTLNYNTLAQESNLYFWVFDDPNFHSIVADFLSDSFVDNHYIKFFHLPSHRDIKFKTIQSIIASQEHLTFSYTALMNQYIKPLEHIHNGHAFLNINNQWSHSNILDKPVILIAAGPSLKKNIQWLKRHHDKFIVVAVSAALVLLEKEGIKPDIVTHIDGFEVSLAHFEKLTSATFLDDCVSIFSASVLEEHIKQVNKENLYLYQNLAQYKQGFGSIVGPCVGSQTFGLLLRLGVTQLYLLGVDLALDQETGQTHTDEHLQAKKLDLSKHDEVEDTFTFASSTISVKGNFTETVMTTSSFKISINTINQFIDTEKKIEQQIYNLNSGAYFHKTSPLYTTEIELTNWPELNKQAIKNALKQLLEEHAQKGLTTAEHDAIKKKLLHAQELKQLIQDYQAKSITSNIDEYKQRFITFIDSLLAMHHGERYNLSIIYLYYLNNTVTYIFDILNTKELKNHKHHIKKINKILTTIVLEIEESYEKRIATFSGEENT